MSQTTKQEYLSALLDGEAGSFEQHRLCDALDSDTEMQTKLANYALIGEAMRNQQQTARVGPSFLAGIQEALKDEAIPSPELVESTPNVIPLPAKRKPLWPAKVAGYAVAASVVAVAAVSLQNYFTAVEPAQTIVSVAEPAVPVVAQAEPKAPVVQVQKEVAQLTTVRASFAPAAEPVYGIPDAAMRGMIDDYVAQHFQYASSNTLMPAVRAVSYSTDFR